MILSDWIKDYTKQKDTIDNYQIIADDILAQLLGFICRRTDNMHLESSPLLFFTTGINKPLRINPDNIEVEITDKNSGFVDLKLSENDRNNDYSEKLRKSGLVECDEEKDNVLAAGIIYTEIKYGEPFYYDCTSSSVNDDELLQKMIAVKSNERVRAREALEILAQRYDNKCTVNVNYIESDTGMLIHTQVQETNGSVGELKPQSEVKNVTNSMSFYVWDTGIRKVYFRAAPIYENVICSPIKTPQECNIGIQKSNMQISVGLDFGLHKVNVSCVGIKGDVIDIFGATPVGRSVIYPIAFACAEDKTLKFGLDAVRCNKENAAQLLYIFDKDISGSIEFMVGGGKTESIAAKDVLEKFLYALKKSILERMIVDEGEVSFVYTLPDGFEETKKEWIRAALKVSGFGNTEITTGNAAACCIFNNFDEKADSKSIIIIDAGESAVHVEVVRRNEKKCYETLYSNNAPGGDEISRELLHIVNNTIVKDYPNINDPRNAEAVKNGVEALKRAVTYTYQNDRQAVKRYVLIKDENGEHKQSVKQNRKAVERISQPVINKINSVFSECRNYCKENNISVSNVIVIGGVSVLTQLRDSVRHSFSELRCKIDFDECFEAVSRGAAIYGCLNRENIRKSVPAEVKPLVRSSVLNGGSGNIKTEAAKEIKPVSDVTTKEYGIQIQSSVRSDLVFRTMISCPKKYENNRVGFDTLYQYKVTDSELQKGECSLRLYTREAGKENVRSTIEDNCNAIRAIGKLIFKLPADFNIDKDYFMVNMYADRTDKIYPEIEWRRKTKSLFRSDSSKVMKQTIVYDFIYIK